MRLPLRRRQWTRSQKRWTDRRRPRRAVIDRATDRAETEAALIETMKELFAAGKEMEKEVKERGDGPCSWTHAAYAPQVQGFGAAGNCSDGR